MVLYLEKNPFKETVLELAIPPNTLNDLIKGDKSKRNFSAQWPHCKPVFCLYKKLASGEAALPNQMS